MAGDDQRLCDFYNLTSLHALEHLAHIRLFMLGEASSGVGESVEPAPYLFIYFFTLTANGFLPGDRGTLIHSVGPFVVIALHSKNVFVLGEEFFQFSRSSITAPLQSRPVTLG
jgi:hypothetical protein